MTGIGDGGRTPAVGEIKKTVIRLGSGTSGTPHFTIRAVSEEDQPAFNQKERPLVLFGAISVRLNHAVRLLYSGTRVQQLLCLDAADSSPSLDMLFSSFAPDALRGTTSFCNRALEFVHDTTALSAVEVCSISGEVISRTEFSALARKLPRAFISVAYASSETGMIGRSCPDAPLGAYHPVAGVCAEVIAVEDGVGELVVSTAAVKDHKTGDSARMLGPCACGKKVTFELLGRINFDFIRLAGATLFQKEFDRVAKELAVYVADYRAVAKKVFAGRQLHGKITLSVVPRAALRGKNNPEAFISKEFARRLFLTATQTLEDLVKQGAFLPLSVLVAEEFQHQNKEMKLRLHKE